MLLTPLLLAAAPALDGGPAGAPLAAARPHADSVSHTRAAVRPGHAEVRLRFQTASLLEVLPRLDADLDARFTPAELAAAEDAVGAYLREHWRLLLPPFEEQDSLAGTLTSLGFATDLRDVDESFQWIDARLEWATDDALEDVVVHSELFTERDPYHRDFLEWTYADETSWYTLFRFGEHRWRFRAAALRVPEVRGEAFTEALRDLAGRLEPALFVLALVAVVASLRAGLSFLVWTSAWAAAGFVLDTLEVAPPLRIATLALPLSVAYLGAESLLRRVPRRPWVETALFGLFLGLVTAAALAVPFEAEPLQGAVALGAGGALTAALVGAGLFALALVRVLPGERARAADGSLGWAARRVLVVASLAATLGGLARFLAATGWLR